MAKVVNQSNSGAGACGLTASGKRKDGVQVVVDLVSKHPGMDGFCLAWLHAGGQVLNGQLTGSTQPLSMEKFAAVVSMQKRVLDAEKTGRIEPCKSKAVVRVRDGRVIKAKAYKLPGHGHLHSNPSPVAEKPQPKAAVPSAEASAIVGSLMDFLGE